MGFNKAYIDGLLLKNIKAVSAFNYTIFLWI